MVEKLKIPDHIPEEKLLTLADHERNHITKVLERTLWRINGPKGAAHILICIPKPCVRA